MNDVNIFNFMHQEVHNSNSKFVGAMSEHEMVQLFGLQIKVTLGDSEPSWCGCMVYYYALIDKMSKTSLKYAVLIF